MLLMNDGTMYNQKDIVLIPFPYTDLTGIKKRPALIISNSTINVKQDRICCLITSNPSKEGILLTERCFAQGKLPFKSWVKPHRIFTIHERIIEKKLCTLTNQGYDAILIAIHNCITREKER